MNRIKITSVVPLVTEITFTIKSSPIGSSESSIPGWVIEKFGKSILEKRYGPWCRVETPNGFGDTRMAPPILVRINVNFWHSSTRDIPTHDEIMDETLYLKTFFQEIVDAWVKDIADDDEKECEIAKNRTFKPFPPYPGWMQTRSKRSQAVREMENFLKDGQDRFFRYKETGKLNDAYISQIDYDYFESIYFALLGKRFNRKVFSAMVSHGDTSPRERLPKVVHEIAEPRAFALNGWGGD